MNLEGENENARMLEMTRNGALAPFRAVAFPPDARVCARPCDARSGAILRTGPELQTSTSPITPTSK